MNIQVEFYNTAAAVAWAVATFLIVGLIVSRNKNGKKPW